tara:strand:- start:2916 stop:4067 length:1152 start_codon:yes stop_codon:yes gene_type:complete
MLKNKIYIYFFKEISKSFITILFAFSIIAWTVRSVNFLDLIVDDGHSLITYLYFSALNITNVITKFIPLAFLLSLNFSLIRFERQNELVILWMSGIRKIKLVNLFLLFSLFVLLLQLIFSIFVTPYTLNKSRALVRDSTVSSFDILIKTNNFSDSLNKTTFFVEKINDNRELETIFIRDESNVFKSLSNASEKQSNVSIFANRGKVQGKKIILFNGIIQSQNEDGRLNNLNFKKTELNINNISTKSIKIPKIQETSTVNLLSCFSNSGNFILKNLNYSNCNYKKETKEVFQQLSRRLATPFYIPLIALISCFLLVTNFKKKKKYLNNYSISLIGFMILILAEIFLRYTGTSKINTISYFLFPALLIPITYLLLFFKTSNNRSQ